MLGEEVRNQVRKNEGLAMVLGSNHRGLVMQIHVTCPNGHKLKVARKFAGKSGKCPSCQAVVQIPELSTRDAEEDLVMDILASRVTTARTSEYSAAEALSDEDLPVHQDTRHANAETREFAADDSATAAEGGSSVMRRAARRCSGCGHRVSGNFSVCPHCKRYLTETAEATEHESLTCPSCGVPSFPGSDVCMNCGLQLLVRD